MVKEKVIEVLENIGIVLEDRDEDVNLDEYGIDSIGYITLMCDLEEKFNIEFSNEYFGKPEMLSLNGIVNSVISLLNKNKL